jgi:hypothetical protein
MYWDAKCHVAPVYIAGHQGEHKNLQSNEIQTVERCVFQMSDIVR